MGRERKGLNYGRTPAHIPLSPDPPDRIHDKPDMNAAEARELFERELETVDSLIRSTCRRHGLEGDDADSFASFARFKLIDGDYAVLRSFSGRSSLKTYLSVVVANCHRDFRISRWGKWRPSAAAKRLGPLAVLLDTYLNRDRQPLEEAIRRVLTRGEIRASEAELRKIAGELPRRPPRAFDDLRSIDSLPSAEAADGPLLDLERGEALEEVRQALDRALCALPDQDQVILKLRFWEGMTIADIARTLGIPQKPLYRRIDADLRRLRAALEAEGVAGEDIAELTNV